MRLLGEQQAAAQKQVQSGRRLGTMQLTATLLNTLDCFLLLLLLLPPGTQYWSVRLHPRSSLFSMNFVYMCLLFFLGVGFVFSYLDAAGGVLKRTSPCPLNVPGSLGSLGSPLPAGDINAAAGLPASRATLTFGIYGALARVVANCALDYTRSKPNGGPLTYIALSLLALAAGWTVALLSWV